MISTTLSDRAAASNEGIKVDTGAVSGLNMIAARFRPGSISESNSSHLPASEASKRAKPVMPARLVEPRDDAGGDGIDHARKDDRDRPRLPLEGNGRRSPVCHDDVGLQADQLLRQSRIRCRSIFRGG